jgi:hypothetical protein
VDVPRLRHAAARLGARRDLAALDDENFVEGVAQDACSDKPREAGADHDRASSVQKPDSDGDLREAESPPRLT